MKSHLKIAALCLILIIGLTAMTFWESNINKEISSIEQKLALSRGKPILISTSTYNQSDTIVYYIIFNGKTSEDTQKLFEYIKEQNK